MNVPLFAGNWPQAPMQLRVLNICTLAKGKHKTKVYAAFINITVPVYSQKLGFRIKSQLKLSLWQHCEKENHFAVII